MRQYFLTALLLIAIATSSLAQNTPLRIIMIGAHPDDCELDGGGTAILYAKMGHAVKFLSVTNGDAGHYEMTGEPLARRRFAEAQEAGKRIGVLEYDVLENHDGHLVPSLDVRMQIARKIREWQADIVFAPRPNDYHPDHRYTGVLVQDAAFMVTVPNIVADTPPLKKNPVFVFFQDPFQRPNPFRPDITVDISPVFEQKVHALDAHESQFYEWLPWLNGILKDVPKDKAARKKWLAGNRPGHMTPAMRTSLEKWYGKEAAAKAQKAEAFEICEYGTQPSDDEIKRLFPMLGKK
jgi:LmbE family N-acetylglucosaminyl deacetylase